MTEAKGDKTGVMALVMAGILLLGVGAYSYHQYVKSKLEKEFAEKERALGQERELLLTQTEKMRGSAIPGGGGALAQPAPNLLTEGTGQNTSPVDGALQMPDVPLPPIPLELLEKPVASGGANDRLAKMEADLAAMKKESDLYQRALEAKAKGTGAEPGTVEPGVEPGRAPVSAVGSVQTEVDAMAEKVRTAAAIAKVVEYDPDWSYVIIDRGSKSEIETGMRFAVRRGADVLGIIKIEEVYDSHSVGQLLTRNKHSPTARKPAPGDDIIAENLF